MLPCYRRAQGQAYDGCPSVDGLVQVGHKIDAPLVIGLKCLPSNVYVQDQADLYTLPLELTCRVAPLALVPHQGCSQTPKKGTSSMGHGGWVLKERSGGTI